ncbi:phosphatidylinositol-specific phospholipase C domain-containing protein [Providencia rettgeri]|uniref:phosphatidylinositol-specific phospholipase C domain-containing protein n=1 Tax=Providencia rettgeri TaxID=587 RepID=UPI0034E06FB3
MQNNKYIDWLKYIADDLFVTDLLIPGTHDAITSTCDQPYYQTQTLSLSEQLNCGVRFFDLRLTRHLNIAHRQWQSNITAEALFQCFISFLNTHPTEFIILRIQNANEKKDDFEPYKQALVSFIKPYLKHFLLPEKTNENLYPWPCVKQLRGKILAIECAPPKWQVSSLENGTRWAHNWHQNALIMLQDNWDGPDIHGKIDSIMTLLHGSDDIQQQQLVLNHISATNGELGSPIAYANIINPIIRDELAMLNHNARKDQQAETPHKGILIFDFIDEDLAQKTIEVNTLKFTS